MFARPILFLAPALLLAACASTTPDEQYAAKECKIVPGQFVNVPKQNPTDAERAEAQLRMQRFAYSRGGYGTGTNMPADAVRDCY